MQLHENVLNAVGNDPLERTFFVDCIHQIYAHSPGVHYDYASLLDLGILVHNIHRCPKTLVEQDADGRLVVL